MKIGLYGINGTYNFGCEAIVRGAVTFIKHIYSNPEIIYFSYSYEYDAKMLSDLNIKVVPVVKKTCFFKKALNRIFSLFNINYQFLNFDYNKILNQIDVLFSIGGDIYTIPKIIRERPKYPFYNQLVHFCDKAIKKSIDVIAFGSSIGPFGNYKKAKNYYFKNLKKYKAIICRERTTLEYLKTNNFSNTFFLPDPAYLVFLNNSKSKTSEYIGINLSPLSFSETSSVNKEVIIKRIAKMVDNIYDLFHKKILFLPHVISKNANDDDFSFLKKIKTEMRRSSFCEIANVENGFLGIKSQLYKCCVVASARMHCAINAVSECIPTLFISYSSKSLGMSYFVYNSSKYVLPIDLVFDELANKISFLLQKESEISNYLFERKKSILEEYNLGVEKIKIAIKS